MLQQPFHSPHTVRRRRAGQYAASELVGDAVQSNLIQQLQEADIICPGGTQQCCRACVQLQVHRGEKVQRQPVAPQQIGCGGNSSIGRPLQPTACSRLIDRSSRSRNDCQHVRRARLASRCRLLQQRRCSCRVGLSSRI